MDRVENSLQRIEISVAELNERTKHLATSNDIREILGRMGEMNGRMGEMSGRMAGLATSAEVNLIKGRIEAVPTTWQIIGILSALLLGVATFGFAAASIIRATQKSPPALTAPAPK